MSAHQVDRTCVLVRDTLVFGYLAALWFEKGRGE
jgi:hypothetical protein